jgi:FkbM family methyltransferase
MPIKIYYGIKYNKIDVTEICYNKLLCNNIIKIPPKDFSRSNYFSDPLYGTLKKIFIVNENNQLIEYDDKESIYINIISNEVYSRNIDNEIAKIHSQLRINHGSIREELPEQEMAVTYLTGNEKVLEIGGNIGRNSLVIGHILKQKNNNNFVTLECDPDIANMLIENRNLNNMNFHIENSALSKRKLIQRGWDTFPTDEIIDGAQYVNNISWEELINKYNIAFDTLILDCEGAFYYILMDMPEILNNIDMIIMENDYHEIDKKEYVDSILKQNNFSVCYSEPGGWGPCFMFFYEVWKRNV